MMRGALLLPLLLALPARAEDQEIIDDAALEADVKELFKRYEQVRKRTMPPDAFVQYYQQRAQAKGTPKEQAIAAYFYGFVLNNIADSKDTKDAKRELDRAVALKPGLLPAYLELAHIAEKAGDRTEAERLLRRAIELRRTYVRAWVELGMMWQRAGELERAKEMYEQSIEIEPVVQAFFGIIVVDTRLFQASFDDKRKEQLASEALAAADAIMTLRPDDPQARFMKAQTYLDLGRPKEAAAYLEEFYADGARKPEVTADILRMLRGVYQAQDNVEGVKTTIQRLAKCETLRPEERARIAERVKDIDEMGRWAFTKWGIEDAFTILHNPGLSVEDRLYVLRKLQEFVNGQAMAVPALRPLVLQAWRECFRILVDGPPELVVEQLRSLRAGGCPPRLMAVLVHFVYPSGKTEEVREEGLRTVAASGGLAALPALYYSLQDASGRVVREADAQLAVLCERRSPFGSSIEPLTPEERNQALKSWTAHFHSPEGAAQLAKAFEQLSACVVRVDPDRTSAPMIDHAAHVILDGDVPWVAWAAAYDFLVKYWGKDFRPVERRGKAVEEFERDPIVKAFQKDFNPEAAPEPEDDPAEKKPADNAGKKGN